MNTLLETSIANGEQNILSLLVDTLISWCLSTGLKVVLSLILLVISFRVITVIARKIEKRGNSDKYDKTIMRTIAYIFNIGAKVLVTVSLIGYVGIDTSGITALIASLGVCFGLAVNGAVANLAGGVLIIVTRPFKVDDYIEAQGISGTVEDIHMTRTKIRTPDNKIVYSPNGSLSNGNITNYSVKTTRRIDFTFSIGYSSDYNKAKELISELIDANDAILKTPAPYVGMSKHNASSIDIATRIWVNSSDYGKVNLYMLENVKRVFDENKIEIPFNQLDVHVINNQ